MPPVSFPFALAALFVASAAAAPASAAPPDTALYERVFMLEADKRCALFRPEVRTALAVAAAQARSAAVRARRSPDVAESRARARARKTSCASPGLRLAADRVRAGHAGWAKLQRVTFPGQTAAWRADRTASDSPRWRLVQVQPGASFGLAQDASGALRPYALARFPKRTRPGLARLTVGRRVFLAETSAPAPETLTFDAPRGLRPPPVWAYRFPAAAGGALDLAGPQDVIRLDFITPGRDGDRTSTVVIERGDYAAGRAFIGGRAAAPVSGSRKG